MPADKPQDGKQSAFKVSDRRSFSESGEPKPAVNAEPTATATATATATPSTTPAAAAGAAPLTPSGPSAAAAPSSSPLPGAADLPAIDFHTFILSLGSSALLHLGELDQPDGSPARPDLRLAKHTIDIIAMLQEKTKGNLSPPEERLMESLLFDLRLRFVERSKGAPSGA